ncbi:hypothetical protein QUB07_33780 [Microcoleus sp. F8-C5]
MRNDKKLQELKIFAGWSHDKSPKQNIQDGKISPPQEEQDTVDGVHLALAEMESSG